MGGQLQIVRLADKYGVETIKTAFAEVQDYVEKLTRQRMLAEMKTGTPLQKIVREVTESVDAFSTEPYRGNPAGICVLAAPAPDGGMQSVAIEMNHAETAFLVKVRTGSEDGYDLRWFTPAVEDTVRIMPLTTGECLL